MTINYTTLLGLAKPVTGTETGQWGDVVNNEITSLLEDAVANAATFSVTSGNVTGLTDRLERRGWVRRELSDAGDTELWQAEDADAGVAGHVGETSYAHEPAAPTEPAAQEKKSA